MGRNGGSIPMKLYDSVFKNPALRDARAYILPYNQSDFATATRFANALIRTGIGALIIGVGELIYQFTQLAEKVGGMGAAFGLLRDVAAEAWDRLALAATSAWSRVEAGWAGTPLLR